MSVWNDFLHGSLPYQEYWLPVAIGTMACMFCLFLGNRVWRGKRTEPAAITPNVVSTPAHDPVEKGTLIERRKSRRRTGNLVEVLLARPDSKHAPQRALVLDRSIGGLRLAGEDQFEPDTRLIVLPVSAVDQTPWVEIDVRTCNRVEDCWELGCQFVQTPQWSILLMFG